ncbi:MAG: hypothetical protein JEZ07_16195 [Phycisphaerae bacterium]|nr:hypothetical protein [Phycisphaerae bacterium]
MICKNCTKSELTIAFYWYCIIPLGRIHRTNPAIIAIAARLGRTPGALAMKMYNFANFDPICQAPGIKGLKNTSKGDRAIWDEFNNNFDDLLIAYAEANTELDNNDASGMAGSLPEQMPLITKTEGHPITLPDKFAPDKRALEYHQNKVFEKTLD